MTSAAQYRGPSTGTRPPLAVAVAAAMGLSPVALVHAATDESYTLEEIVVTSTRRSVSLQEVPLNITAISSTAIQDLRLDNVNQLTRWVPGIVSIDQGPWNNNRLITRGLNADSIASVYGAGDGGTVATYLGETPLFVDFRLLDIDRVEVLIGPQGTLYGAGTLGGAVRYIPNKPDLQELKGTFHVRGYSLAHSDDLGYQGDAAFNLPLVDGKLALRAVVGYYRGAGFIDNPLLVRQLGVSDPEPDVNDPAAVAANLVRRKDVNYDHTLSSRVSLRYQPIEQLDALLTYAHQDTRSAGRQVTSTPQLGTGPYESAVHVADTVHRTADLVSLELNAELGFAQLVSSSSYAETQFDFVRDQTDQLLEFQYGYEQFPQFVAFAVGDAPNDDIPGQQFVQEVRLVSSGSGAFKWIGGGYYSNSKEGGLYREFVPGFPQFAGIDRPDNLEYYAITPSELTEKAAFGELGYQFTDAWQVTVGGRYFEYENSQTSGVALPLFTGPTDVIPNSRSLGVDQHGSIFKFNTSYQFTPDLMLYATVSEGYRRGGVNTVPPCITGGPPQSTCALPREQVFLPDKTRNHELGLRSTWFDQSLVVNGALYYVTWRDVRVGTVTEIGGQAILGNGAEAVTQGVELQFQAALSRNFSLRGSYAYNDAHLTQDVPGLVVDRFGRHDAFDGDRLPGSARQTGSLGLLYSQQMANDFVLGASYGVSATGDVITKVGERANGEKLGGYALHSASIDLSKNRWRATLFADNLFDKYAYTGTVQDSSNLHVVNGFLIRRYQHSVVRPRQIGLELSMTF